ncbi:MAG: hypothetical protein GY901_12070 [Actinomycetia bacterium]|nr:hypothetical protein [Actinomycetes bacterium]
MRNNTKQQRLAEIAGPQHVAFTPNCFRDTEGGPSANEQAEWATWLCNWFENACPPAQLTRERFKWLNGRFGLSGLGSEDEPRTWWGIWCKESGRRDWVIGAITDWAEYVAPSEQGPWSDLEQAVGFWFQNRESLKGSQDNVARESASQAA